VRELIRRTGFTTQAGGTIETVRHDWFWWGDGDPLHFNIKRRSEVHKSIKPGTDAPAGTIRRVLIANVIARGRGSSIVNGHPDSWLEDITVDNFKLYVSSDPKAPYDKAVHGLTFRQVKNLTLKGVEVFWGEPGSAGWQSALSLEEIKGLVLDGFVGRQARAGADTPAVVLNRWKTPSSGTPGPRRGQGPSSASRANAPRASSCSETISGTPKCRTQRARTCPRAR
jgi:hypothetical protein